MAPLIYLYYLPIPRQIRFVTLLRGTLNMPSQSTALVWLRRDLRLEDHRPLWKATQKFNQVYLIFFYDQKQLESLKSREDERLAFITEHLKYLRKKLGQKTKSWLAMATFFFPQVLRSRVYFKIYSQVAQEDRGIDFVHRARKPLGERL